MRLSPAFPLLRTERASFQAFRVPSSDGFLNYKKKEIVIKQSIKRLETLGCKVTVEAIA
ncbi:hypothetical protein J7E63_26355 [Bacillus sp. ISL-75]|uniref:hypothetical protein n=1 Tax=Bacillus sp. ISL-75 TaxID=2819137 RepID=UPI001BECE89B|nr:hypothetical protein [Bacillus sp. ISL-75]MBT2730361.1 hypothetical protein [Bacillus sp. ISL-75]